MEMQHYYDARRFIISKNTFPRYAFTFGLFSLTFENVYKSTE